MERRKVSWVVEVDIRQYFDRIEREQLMQFLEMRIGDRRVLRLIRKWLNAGVIEAGLEVDVVRGTPQGAVISPLLANVYLPPRARRLVRATVAAAGGPGRGQHRALRR